MMDYASKKISENADLKKYLLKFVHNADFNITGMNSHEDDNAIPLYIDSNNSKEKEKKSFIIHRTDTDFEHTIQTEEGLYTFTLPSRYQSEGTQRIFGLETAIYECTTKNRILMVDEMENSLHPDLVERVIKDYLQKGESSSQLLITTHYDLLLNSISKDFRKDAIWFTEKNADGGSKLYPLIKYSGLNKMSSYQKVYRNGGFGAIPKR
jgi:predicted ATPase